MIVKKKIIRRLIFVFLVFFFYFNFGFADELIDSYTGAVNTGEEYGYCVRNVGDFNGDGVNDYVIGNNYYGNNTSKIDLFSGATRLPLMNLTNLNCTKQKCIEGADVNGDGYNDLLVGDITVGNGAGEIFIYSGQTQTVLYQLSGPAGSLLGYNICSLGDLDQDGCEDFAASAPNDRVNKGLIQAFSGRTGTVLYSIQGGSGDYLGGSLDTPGDVNNDGYLDLMVASIAKNFVNIYSGKDGTFIYSVQSPSSTPSLFGIFVGGIGDVNRDNHDDFAITEKTLKGTVHIYSGLNGVLLKSIEGRMASPFGEFGASFTTVDVDRDGRKDLIVSDPRDKMHSISVFSGPTLDLIKTFSAETSFYSRHGHMMDALGDINGDNYEDIIMSNTGYRIQSSNNNDGLVYVYTFHPPGEDRGVTFETSAKNLTSIWNQSGTKQILLKDRFSLKTISLSNSQLANGDCNDPALSSQEKFVVYTSYATNIVFHGAPQRVSNVYVTKVATGYTRVISSTLYSTTANTGNADSGEAKISVNGQWVTFSSFASDLDPRDTDSIQDIYLYNHARDVNLLELISVTAAGQKGNGPSSQPDISADGRFVVFTSEANNLVPNDTNGKKDIFLKDTVAGTITRVSLSRSGQQLNGDSCDPAISADGLYIIYKTDATNIGGFTLPHDDVVRVHRVSGNSVVVSTDGLFASDGPSRKPSLSYNGRYVVFESEATNLISNDTNNLIDVFVKDMTIGTMRRFNVSNGQVANNHSFTPHVSPDGIWATFESEATNLTAIATNNRFQVYAKHLMTGQLFLISSDNSNNAADNDSHSSRVSN